MSKATDKLEKLRKEYDAIEGPDRPDMDQPVTDESHVEFKEFVAGAADFVKEVMDKTVEMDDAADEVIAETMAEAKEKKK